MFSLEPKREVGNRCHMRAFRCHLCLHFVDNMCSVQNVLWLDTCTGSRNQWNIKAQILKMCSTSAKGGEKGDPNRNPWLAKMISPSRVLILFVFYIRHISSSRVLIFWLCSMFITSVLYGFWFSVCVLCSSHQSFTSSDSLVVFYIHHISPSRVLTLCLCSISIPSVIHVFWFSGCALYLSH